MITALIPLIEASADTIIGFDDFHQLSASYIGLASMSSEYTEVINLVTSLSHIIKSQNKQHKWKPGQTYVKSDRVGMAFYGLKVCFSIYKSILFIYIYILHI